MNNFLIETTRHSKHFTRDRMGNMGVTVIGAGATGSIMALSFAKLGVEKIDVWDDDVVESHNLANQMYGPEHIGMSKVEALKQVIERQTGTTINAFNRRVGPGDGKMMREVVAVLVDSMDGPEGRRGIAQHVILGSPAQFVLETRLGVEHAMVYAINPRSLAEYEGWTKSMYSDAFADANTEADPDGCNAQQTIAGTVKMVAGLAEWQFLYWLNGGEYSHETIISMRPLFIDSGSFK